MTFIRSYLGEQKFGNFDSEFSPVVRFNFEDSEEDQSGNNLTLTPESTIIYSEVFPGDRGVVLDPNNILTVTSSDVYRILGDLTFIVVIRFLRPTNGFVLNNNSDIVIPLAVSTTGETEDTNTLYRISLLNNTGTLQISYFHETGDGTNIEYVVTSSEPFPDLRDPICIATTRINNIVQVYVNGYPWGQPSGTLTAPTGGTLSVLTIPGSDQNTDSINMRNMQIIPHGLNAEQIKKEYNKSLGKFFGTI